MKQTALEDAIQARMQPGVITRDGLLGADGRALAEILTDDAAEVARLGVTHSRIAARMRAMRRAGASALGEPVFVEPHFEVSVDGIRGKLYCPFGDGRISKNNTKVTNTRLGKTIHFTDLLMHLIGHHGFYLGQGAKFRISPAELVEVLEVEPEE